MEDVFIPVAIVGMLFIGLPWLIFHYVTQWKKSGSINREDEDLLDELYDLARRLDDRMNSIERIIAAENPDWRPTRPELGHDPMREERLEDELRQDRPRTISRI
jgi:phage shock protein B